MFEHAARMAIAWRVAWGLVLGVACGAWAADNTARVQELTGRLTAENQNTREYAAKALVGLAPDIQAALPALTDALADKHAGVRYNAARALGLVGAQAQSAIPALAAALKLKDWAGNAQSQAAIALGRMGTIAAVAAPDLAEMLAKDAHPMARREAARALGSIGPSAIAAQSALDAALHDENGFVRVAAAAALWQVAQDARGIPLIEQALLDPTIVGVRVAADTLAELGAGARPAIPALVQALQDPAAVARVAAARALWYAGRDTQGVPVLLAALDEECVAVRQDAAAALRLPRTEAALPVPGVAEALAAYDAAAAAPPPADPNPPLVFEAEAWSGPADAWQANTPSADKWNLWSTDVDAMKKWSGGVVLQSPAVTADRATAADGAPPLHTRITGIPPGKYDVAIKLGRVLAVSFDGTTWKRQEGGALGTFEITDGSFDLWVDDRYASAANIGFSYYDCLTFKRMPEPPAPPAKVQGWATARVNDKLDRGLAAVRLPAGAGGGVYLSWRLLPDDAPGIAFDVLRQDAHGAPRRLNPEPITATTDFIDAAAPREAACQYTVVLAGQAQDRVRSPSVAVGADAAPLPYTAIKFQGEYAAQKVGIADLDGDGRLDFVIKQPNQNIDPYYTYWSRSPTTHKLEAYDADGRFLWRHDLGWGIELGVWFSPFIVYDLDGDGRAEVICKASAGDPRDADGKVFSGPEYVMVLDGMTGKERCRADWPSRDGFTGESAHNLAARNQLGIAYLDGKTPCVIAERGTYSVQKVAAFQLRENRLEQLWAWDNRPEGKRYRGQGAHILLAADVDGDGRDEVILGSSVLDDNGAALWTTGLGHPDNCYVGEIDPRRPGLEIFYNLETPAKQNGVCLVDAATGAFIWGISDETFHVGSGVAADIDPAHPGCECWAGEDPKSGAFKGAPPPRWLYSAQGELLAREPRTPPFGLAVVYWDADPQRELLRAGQVRNYKGGVHLTGIDGTVLAIADIAGDWREEIVTALKGELRIYRTTVPADWRHVTLWADPIYRLGAAGYSSGYAQVPSSSFCLAETYAAMSVTGPDDGLAPDADNACAVAVTAPGQAELSGTLTITAGSDATVAPASIPVHVGAGAAARYAFSLRLGAAPSPVDGRRLVPVTAVLTSDRGGAVSARASFAVADRPLTGVPLVQAEAFVEQSGGEVRRRDDKPGSSGQAISHWDNKGHRLTWRMAPPRAGKYHLVVRYAWTAESLRRLLVDGTPLPGAELVRFPPSNGGGDAAGDWAHHAVRTGDGQLAVLTLTAGPHTFTLENTDGRPLNLDYLALIPAE